MLKNKEKLVKSGARVSHFSAKQKKQISILLFVFVLLVAIAMTFLFFIFKCGDNETCGANLEKQNNLDYQAVEATEDNLATDNTELNNTENVAANNLEGASVALEGTSLVAQSGQVINNAGVVVKNEAAPMTDDAPRLSAPLNKAELTTSVVKLEATVEGFKPKTFTVSAGQVVTLALTSNGVDSRLVFSDPNLAGLELPVPNSYTMAKTFNAPATAGEYIFYQDISGRKNETGRMIVN